MIAALLLLSVSQHTVDLGPGEYRWQPVTVTSGAPQVTARFRVLTGGRVHLELIRAGELRQAAREATYDALVQTPSGSEGVLERVLDENDRYDLLIVNDVRTQAVRMDLVVENGPVRQAQMLPRRRQLTVILVSFGLFFAMVAFSGWKLIRGFREPR